MVNPIARSVPVKEYNDAKTKKYGIAAAAAADASLDTTNDCREQSDEMNVESQPSHAAAREPPDIATRPRRGLPARKRNNRNNSTSNVDSADSDSDVEGGENNMSFTNQVLAHSCMHVVKVMLI